jgi:hypothetical protein
MITFNEARMNSGMMKSRTGFYLVEVAAPDKAVDMVRRMVCEHIPQKFGHGRERRSSLGTSPVRGRSGQWSGTPGIVLSKQRGGVKSWKLLATVVSDRSFRSVPEKLLESGG